ncbi:MAG: 3-dehydroquinate synthase [Winogradskyella sp.]|nr:3-dehydroquinate synthase [Winogradskyella sp.]
MTSIESANNKIYFNELGYKKLEDHIHSSNYSNIFVLVDENTKEHCLRYFCNSLKISITTIKVLTIEAGEVYKTIDTCVSLWQSLTDNNADRKSLLINLGGGVITDLGGFVACTFKRGINYVNIPTSLLAMVDASVGGKTGVDLGVLKNQIGVISNAEMVLIDSAFLKTLPKEQMVSGFAEMLKHGLIYDSNYWKSLMNLTELNHQFLDSLILRSIEIKHQVVSTDPNESGLRKILNFGHTIGHAIESYFLNINNRRSLLHGEAIAIGMVVEAYMSLKLQGLQLEELHQIKATILKWFGQEHIKPIDYEPIIDLMRFDKKNSHGKIKYVLINSIGKATFDLEVDSTVVKEGLDFYNE